MASVPGLIERARTVMSPYFLKDIDDDTLVALMEIVLSEINNITPMTYYSLCDAPKHWEPTIILGLQVFVMLSLQATLSLKDFNYNDNGLSLSLNRVQNLNIPINTLRPIFESNAWNLKKPLIFRQGPLGMGYPRYQATVSAFLRILFGNSWKF